MEIRDIPTALVHFGIFDADIQTGELWRNGLKVRIQELPFQVLASLLERPGEVITREELQKRLWPADTFVDFEQGLNKAINKLREALGDDANNPRFVETLPRRGYRFIAPVDSRRVGQATDAGHSATSPALPQGVPRRQRWPLALTGLVALMAVVGLVWFATRRPPPPRPEPRLRRLTANPAGNPATDPRISPDGKYLAYDDQAGIHLQLIGTGETRTIPQPRGLGHDVTGWLPIGWFPNGTRLLAEAMSLVAERNSLWVISMLGGAPREIHEGGGFAWSVSPDGSLLAYTSAFGAPDIWLMGAGGEDPRKIVSAGEGERLIRVVWSPNGRRIAYARLGSQTGGPRCSIESLDLQGGQPVVVVSDPKLEAGFRGGFWWLEDGRLIYSLGETVSGLDSNLWEIKVDAVSGQPAGESRRITNWTESSLKFPNASADGKRLVFSRVSIQTDAYVADLEAGGMRLKTRPRRLTFDERNDVPTAWTPDGKAILLMSDRSGSYHIYKQTLDQDSAEPLVATPHVDWLPRLSPDGKWVIFASFAKLEDLFTTAPAELWRVPVSGGPLQRVLTVHGWFDHHCARAPATLCLVGEMIDDKKQLVFTSFDPIKGRGREIARIVTNPLFGYNWDLSPDGSKIAVLFHDVENHIRMVPLEGGPPRDIVVNGGYSLNQGPEWSPDGRGFYTASMSPMGWTLLYVDLQGHATALWKQKGDTFGVPSPDGRHLAILGQTVDSNVWMLENF